MSDRKIAVNANGIEIMPEFVVDAAYERKISKTAIDMYAFFRRQADEYGFAEIDNQTMQAEFPLSRTQIFRLKRQLRDVGAISTKPIRRVVVADREPFDFERKPK